VKKQDGNIILTVEEYNKLINDNLILKEELAQLKRMIFGKKNEKFITTDDKQLNLFGNDV